MSLQVGWYAKKRIIFCKAEGKLSLDEVRFLIEKSYELNQQNPQAGTLHSFCDMQAVSSLPTSLGEIMSIIRDSRSRRPPNRGWVVIVGSANRLLQFLFITLSHTFKFRLRVVASMEEGLSFLQNMDDDLPPLLPFDSSEVEFVYAYEAEALESSLT